MSNAKRIIQYIQSETTFSGVARYPVAIDDIAAELALDQATLLQELKALNRQGILEFCAVGNSSVRLQAR